MYFRAKKHVFDAEKYTRITDQRILVSLRDALDDLATTLCLKKEKISECKRHLYRAAYAAWQDAAGLQVDKLEKRLTSWGVGGSIDEANRLLDLARDEIAQGREVFSQDPEKAIELEKNSALHATEGLSKVTESPRISRVSIALAAIGVILTVVSVVVTILNFLK